MNRSPEPAGVGCAPKHSLCGQAMVGAETASTAGTSLWDSTAPDGTRAMTLYPLSTLSAFPGEAGSCPLYRNEAAQSWLQHI